MALSLQDDPTETTGTRGLPQTSRGRILAHLAAALLAAVVVFAIGTKLMNDRYFSGPVLTFLCEDGSSEESDELLTRSEMDDVCGNTTVPPAPVRTTTSRPYAEVDAGYVRHRWPDITEGLDMKGFPDVDPTWLSQFDDSELALLVQGVCVEAAAIEPGEDTLTRLAIAAIDSNDLVTTDDKTSMTGIALIAVHSSCQPQGLRLDIERPPPPTVPPASIDE